MTAKKSTQKTIKLATAYKKLTEALATEAITGKNYRAIQKFLVAIKKKGEGLVAIKCNAKKEVLIAEAKRVLAKRCEREIRNQSFVIYEAMIAASA